MKPRLQVLFLLLSLYRAAFGAAAESGASKPHPLVWDAMEKTMTVQADGESAKFQFKVVNQSSEPVEVLRIEPSCGCTVAEMPSKPWILAPGADGAFTADVDYRGKLGQFSKAIYIHSSAGSQILHVKIQIPDTDENRRARNQQLALANRQGVFHGECANCHVVPTVGKTGEALFQTACGICHDANPRASVVPDLRLAREPRDAAYWEKWISEGKEQTLMPAFAAKRGGPLTAEQIASLVEYALASLPTRPQPN